MRFKVICIGFMALDGLGNSVAHVFDSLHSGIGGVTTASSVAAVLGG